MNGKGWHNEYTRHSEARLYGRAGGSKKGLKAPSMPNAVSKGRAVYYKLPNGKYVYAGSSWKVEAYKNVKKQFDNIDKKEVAVDKTKSGIVLVGSPKQVEDFKKLEAKVESKADIEKDYNSVSKPEYQTHKEEKKISEMSWEELSKMKLSDAQKQAKAEEMQREGEIKPDHKITPADYEGFTGTQNYYKDYLGITLTDGTKDLQTRAEANWLTSDIASVVKGHKEVRKQDFVTINFKVKDEQGNISYEDGNGNVIYKQKYKFTDFPEGNWKFFFRDNVLMLPSEY